MNLLSLDASTECVSIALSIHGEIWTAEQQGQRYHAQFLLSMIEKLLTDANCHLSALDGVVYGRGPGSFTGLRIACSIAKGLAYAHGLPLFPVSCLAALAEAYWTDNDQLERCDTVLTVIDARMNQVYWTCFRNSTFEITPEQLTYAHEIVVPDKAITLVGTHYASYLSQFPVSLRERIVQDVSTYPSAKAMLSLAQSGRIIPQTAVEANPVYIRNKITQGEF